MSFCIVAIGKVSLISYSSGAFGDAKDVEESVAAIDDGSRKLQIYAQCRERTARETGFSLDGCV